MKSKRLKGSDVAKIRVVTDRSPRVFAFGDIHGCRRELEVLLESLRSDHHVTKADQFVFIGDYIDRGPDSKGVIDTLLAWKKDHPKTIFLKGNHEDMLLGFLGIGGSSGAVYLVNGGTEFFKSYGIEPTGPVSEMVNSLPAEHLAFLTSLELGVSIGEFLFVHAGINPARALTDQTPHDLMWIRGEFLPAEHNAGKTVVFGHTPFADVMIHLPYKIGIDTGLVYGNLLTAVELVEGTVFQVDQGGEKVTVSSMRDRLDSGSD
jgi:serine/threonine protein phosphatase 1